MSRIGKQPITIPEGVEVKINGQHISVKGPKGLLEKEIHETIKVEMKDNEILVLEGNKTGALEGLTRTLIFNMVEGVKEGFEKKLEIHGVGYRAAKAGNNINLTLGFSHPVVFNVPEGINVEVPSATEIIVTGIDKQLVGEVAANIRKLRPPEVYHGKGIRYKDEYVLRKEGKAGS